MDIKTEREAFERLPLAKLAIESEYVYYNKETNSYWPNEDFCPSDAPETMNFAWEAWQAAKGQAVPEGFVLVPKEPYAYLIKHKLWNKNSQPEIYLADDFIGDDGVEKEKLIVCIPLYKGDDEAQEQK